MPIAEGFKNCKEVFDYAREHWPHAKVKCPAKDGDW